MASTDEFCGIDPEEMGRLASSLRGAADRLTAFSREFDGRLRQYGISAPELREITDIAGWGGEQVSMLNRRIDLITDLGAGAPEPGGAGGSSSLVRFPADLEALETARGLALMYGNIFVNFEGDFQAELIHEHAGEVAALAKNPQAAAAFYALLSPKVRDTLPGLIAATGSKTARKDLAAFGEALGAALRAPVLVPAFARVKTDLTEPAGSKAAAWQRLALLKGAGAPTDVRSAAARSLVLDDFTKNPRQDWRAGVPAETTAYGLPSDLVALGLEVLAGDAAAVRTAFAEMGGGEVKLTQVEKMKRFLGYAKGAGTGDEVADAFGQAMEAGTEAKTEKPGQHGPGAGAFALDVMRATGSFGDGLPAVARDSMVTIATSYIHEVTSGARFDKAVDRTSGMKTPENWTALPGVTPVFYLSPGDTHRFLKTFVGDERLTGDFDAAAARFRYDTLTAAGRLDAKSDENRFERISKMFGDLAGIEFKATLDVRGERDATDDLIRDITKNTLSLGIDRLPVVGGAVEAGWELTKAYGVSTLLDDWADSFETRVEKATGVRSDFVLRQKYDMAQILHEAGYPASDPPVDLVSKSTGGLKTYDELLAEAKREASGDKTWEQALREKLIPYERWMDANDSLDTKVEDSSRFQTSEQAKESLGIWG
ncbi:hypothetical protein [Streptosporangium pseudovulgare]|uniref:Uncharacterized protein n=1 Tax=Streptosporangium pseudovulgare TaxID=35765 RepID=A0ABQ2QGW4_9ACTN|nr:hypothetical protein [Streptosporangium pseudovulgare]GGP81023.1 hypothetical protein GCM10010140_07330 [Streptosporangium pseudovulgare]